MRTEGEPAISAARAENTTANDNNNNHNALFTFSFIDMVGLGRQINLARQEITTKNTKVVPEREYSPVSALQCHISSRSGIFHLLCPVFADYITAR